jgi:hypothetical protein
MEFIIRLYRFEKDNPRNLVGLVEIVGKKGRMGFTTLDELWEILNSSTAHPYLLVGVLEEVGVDGKKDSNIRLFSMGILRGHRKVPIGWLQGDSCLFGAFLKSK